MKACSACEQRVRVGGCLDHRLERGEVRFSTKSDLTGRGEFLVTNKDGSKRWTRGYRDWRNYCKRNGLVEVSPTDIRHMKNDAPKRAMERYRAALPKAVDQAIRKVKQKPYFDKRAIGIGSRPTRDEIRKDFKKQSRRRAA